jgi:hypothetical protein
MSNQARAAIADEIEEAYVEIGRMVVQSAVAQAQANGAIPEGGFEASISIRVQFGSAETEHGLLTCCICTQDVEGVWVCAGPCCPTRNSTW